MQHDSNGYGLWALVLFNTVVFLIFAFSFSRPRTKRDWRTFGAFSGFIVALFTEMYGFPLTIYLLSGVMGDRYPVTDPLAHDNGHLWTTLLRWGGNPHFSPMHLVSYVAVAAGFVILASAWPVLHRAQQKQTVATSGPYAAVRHPQYVGFVLIMVGFLLQWPTLLTLVMFPFLVVMYIRLANREEAEARSEFGESYLVYAARTPKFFPKLAGAHPSSRLGTG